MADASYHFLSWTRRGLATTIDQPDTLGPGQPAHASAAVGVSIVGHDPISHAAKLRGPGDIIQLTERQVIRTDPIDGAVGVEPNYFAQVQFDRPDLPWLFTPAAPAAEHLRPWLVLVVVDLDGEKACHFEQGSPLPILQAPPGAAAQLPDPSASHLWAHVQTMTPEGVSVEEAAGPGADPRLSCSRLLCPRHLDPFKWYLGAVVPAFDVGRLAGLGQTITAEDESSLKPAWQPGAAAELPVFYSFRFRTGEDADFEAIARRLQNRPLPEGVGVRSLDVSRPGAGLPALAPPASAEDPAAIEWLGGALMPPEVESLPQRAAQQEQEFRADLTGLLDRPAELLAEGDEDPVVAPPIYGGQHALVSSLAAGSPPPWIGELNLSAPDRVAAGLGTQVIQDRQEELVARAWQQLGDIRAANDLLRRSQLSRTLSADVHDRIGALGAATVLAVTAPAHGRLAGIAGDPETLARAIDSSRLPNVAVEPAFRRFAAAPVASSVVERFAAEHFAPAVTALDGVTTMRPATEVIGTQAAAVAMQLAGADPGASGVAFDQVLHTLADNVVPLPSPDLLRAAASAGVGGVEALSAIGAVPVSAVHAVIAAASASPGPKPGTPVLPAIESPIRPPLGVSTHLPPGLTLAAGSVGDAQWGQLASAGAVPKVVAATDATVDAGSRLDAIRRDPVAIAALAEVAAGDSAEAIQLEAAVQAVGQEQERVNLDLLEAGSFALTRPPVTAKASGQADLAAAAALRTAAISGFGLMVSGDDGGSESAKPALDLGLVKRDLLARIDPEQTLVARVDARLTLPSTLSSPGGRRDPLDQLVACPQFKDPMWEGLRDRGADWLLPGLEEILPDTATLVRTNPEFVVSHMVGLNHEMMRELLWREFPSGERGTAFTRFWGRSGANPDDIGPVDQFAGELKKNVQGPPGGEAVLLLRSELLRRYPGSIVYLSLGRQAGEELVLDGAPILPVFRGDLPPDVSFVGFPIEPETLRASPEPYYFVIAQPPAEPRFGLDDPSEGEGDPSAAVVAPGTADDLSWSHMSPDGHAGTHAAFASADPPVLHGKQIEGMTWGASAAIQARLTFQHPVRVAIRAKDLLPEQTERGPA